MRRIALMAAVTLVGAGLAGTTGGPGRAATGLAATVKPVRSQAETARFPVFGPDGAKLRDAPWRLTDAGGNCCEVYVASTRAGRLLEFGGTYASFSDDEGVTWQQVEPPAPLVAGEGAIAAAPGGDIVGIGWDAYSGDRLQAYKYDAATKSWSHFEVVLRQPFYDRPWIGVVPGPFTLEDGTKAPYATVVRSNYLSSLHDLFYVSFDGLTYLPSSGEAVQATGPFTTGYVEPAPNDEIEFFVPHPQMRVTPLPRGGFLNVTASRNKADCPSTRYGTDRSWSCLMIPGAGFLTNLQADAKGRLHSVVRVSAGMFRYVISSDGGRTWSETDLQVPNGASVVHENLIDYKVSAALEVAVVAVHADTGSASQDIVYRLDTTGGSPRLVERLHVSAGNRQTGVGVTYDQRFDFASIALLPDGRVAVAFDDASHATPRLAIELPREATPPPTADVTATATPTASPTATPAESPSVTPSATPSATPSETPSATPSVTPTVAPTVAPTATPTSSPPGDTTPPAVAAVLPARLTDPAHVRFDEPVTGVDASNVALRLAGGGVVATATRCRNGTAAVPCGGTVTAVELRPVAALRPGEHYAVAVAPPGTAAPRDAAGNPAIPATFAFRASTDEDHATPAASYAWSTVADPAALGGSYAVDRRAGAHVSYPFSGTSVTWFGATGPDQGLVRVLVDGVDRGTVDTYSATRRWRVGHVVGGLAPGRHVLTLRVLGTRSARSSGTNVVVDAVRAASGTLAANPLWAYAWATAPLPQQGSAAIADRPGAQVTFTFRGTGFEWVTALAPDGGRAAVYVDGRHVATVDNYAATRRYGVRRAVGGLPDGVHRVVVRVVPQHAASRGTLVVVDRWLVH